MVGCVLICSNVIFAGSYPQQAVYSQQSTAPVYSPAMQMSPQAPPYTDTPPAYSEVTIALNNPTIKQARPPTLREHRGEG